MSSPRVCEDGSFCNSGDVCTPDNGCIPVTSERYCGGREFCDEGTACIGDRKCLPVTSERYCGENSYCPEGSYCKDGGCRSYEADRIETELRRLEQDLQTDDSPAEEDQAGEDRTETDHATADRPADGTSGAPDDSDWCAMASRNVALKDTATYYEACVAKLNSTATPSQPDRAWRCKDINGSSYGAAHCKTTSEFLQKARALIGTSPEQAAELYRQAMEFSAKAGDAEMALAIRREQDSAAALSAAMAADAGDDAASGSCVSYFERMRDEMTRNAGICLKDDKLLASLTDMADEGNRENPESIGEPNFTRASIPDFIGTFGPDPRWTIAADDSVTPNCEVPLKVGAQDESYLECWRVYACGHQAAACGLEYARRTKTRQCASISALCLSQHPIPRMAEAPAPENPGEAPEFPAGDYPRQPNSQSTITGPSGSGGGDSGGTVRSAQ